MSEKRSSYMIEKVGIDYQERRSDKRAPVMLSGCLSYGDDGRLADCVVLDISASGAKVKFDKTPGDGEGVNLRLGQRLKIGATIDFPVEVVWQDGSVVGFRFLNDPYEVAGALEEEELLPPECVLRYGKARKVGDLGTIAPCEPSGIGESSPPAGSGAKEAEWVQKVLPPTAKSLPTNSLECQTNGSGRIVVVGNEKGGTGKSTISMHVIMSLLYKGYRVASIDLDTPQRTLSRYLQNRGSIANRQQLKLPFPEHLEAPYRDDEFDSLEEEVRRLAKLHDFVVVDSQGSTSLLSRAIHGWADTLITPINDSLVDLDVLALIDPVSQTMERPGYYGEMVLDARRRKAKYDRGLMDWIVLRNRLSNLASRNKSIVADTMLNVSRQLGFRCCAGLSERVIYKELFLLGLTLVDLCEKGIGVPLSMSHVAARQELRELVTAILPKQHLEMASTDAHSVARDLQGDKQPQSKIA